MRPKSMTGSAALIVCVGMVLAGVTAQAPAQEKEGLLRTLVSPFHAGVFVDGKYYGTARMFSHRQAAIRLSPGEHTVKLVDPGHQALVAKVMIVAGEVFTLRRKLAPGSRQPVGPPYGELKTEDFGNAAVYLNDQYMGNAREFGGIGSVLLVPPGEYKLEIKRVSGGAPHEEQISIKANQTLIVRPR